MTVDTALARELWGDNTIRNDELARRLGVTSYQLHSLRRWLGLPRRYYQQPTNADITVDEIKRRAAAIRKTWSPEERERRCVGGGRKRWSPPSYEYSHSRSAFEPA